MKLTTHHSSKRIQSTPLLHRGFTLIEIMMVITIVAFLAAIATPILMRMVDNARVVDATSQIKEFAKAAREYKKDHFVISSSYGAADNTDDHMVSLTNDKPTNLAEGTGTNGFDELIKSLSGSSSSLSSSKKKYLNLPEHENFLKGAIWNASDEPVGLVDPWGRAYYCIVDVDDDGKWDESHAQAWSGIQNLNGDPVGIICRGPKDDLTGAKAFSSYGGTPK